MFKNLSILSEKYRNQKIIKLLNNIVFLLAIYYLWKKLEIYELEKIKLIPIYSLFVAGFLSAKNCETNKKIILKIFFLSMS